MGWKQSKKWSDKYLPNLKRILGEVFIGEPPISEDQERNTDLIVLNMTGLRFACRLRQEPYFHDYFTDFTLRCSRPSGTKTELDKVVEGWGDYFFYGFAAKNNIFYWRIGDLKVFRAWYSQYLRDHNGKLPGTKIENADKSSSFLSLKWADLPEDFIFAKS